jgi:hypothetical protein
MALAGVCSTPSIADDKQFSICRISYVAHWISKNRPGQISTPNLAKINQLRDFVGGTAPDCYRGEGDAKNDVERMISVGGKAKSCSFYLSAIREILN